MILRGAILDSTRDDSHIWVCVFNDLVQEKKKVYGELMNDALNGEITASVNDFKTRLTTGDRTASSHESMSVSMMMMTKKKARSLPRTSS